MARYTSNPNPYSKILDRKFLHQFFLLLSVVLAMALAYWLSTVDNILVIVLAVAVFVFFCFASRNILLQIGKNDRGAAGEHKVKKILDELSDYYAVYQNVLIRERLDIDFVVVGPKGVFAIEVKSHKGFNMFNRSHFISQTFAETMELKKYLKSQGVDVYVSGLLVFTGAQVRYSGGNKGVQVINKDYLLKFFDRAQKLNYDQAKAETAVRNLYSLV